MSRQLLPLIVIPAKAGIQGDRWGLWPWMPAFAGMTGEERGRYRMPADVSKEG